MAVKYAKMVSTPKCVHTPLANQVQNQDGAWVYELDKWKKLDRFLILGTESSTYYASKEELTFKNYDNVLACIKEDGVRVVNRLTEISVGGRAPKADAALFVLALCLADDNLVTKHAASATCNRVCRIGTHIMTLLGYCDDLRGRGTGIIKMLARWFNDREIGNLVQQVIKYRQRGGFSMRDVLRIARPKANDQVRNDVYHWVVKGWENIGPKPHPEPNLARIWAFEKMKKSESPKEIARLVSDYHMPWETVDSKWLNEPIVWDSLLGSIKPEALIRHLSRLSSIGYTKPMSNNTLRICNILKDRDALVANKVHPIKILVALKTYSSGHGVKGNLTWNVNQDIVAALEEAFELSFGAVQPTNKRIFVCDDVSASTNHAAIEGLPLTVREVGVAMAMIYHRLEPLSHVVTFSRQVIPLAMTKRSSFKDVMEYVGRLQYDYTDMGKAIEYALDHKLEADAIVYYSDNDVNHGTHCSEAIKIYRKKTGLRTKLIVNAMTPTGTSVVDPKDSLSLDVVGFDTSAPQIISDFIGGLI